MMKSDVLRTLAGVGLIAGAAFIIVKVYRRSTEGRVDRMKAPFVAQVLPYPITTDLVSAPFGELRGNPASPHTGIDLKTRFNAKGEPDPKGSPDIGMFITAPFDGVVTSVFNNVSGGNQLEIKAKDGTRVGFAHLLKVTVNPGESFVVGDILGATGATGQVTGPHLHLNVTDPGGTRVDPAPYLGL